MNNTGQESYEMVVFVAFVLLTLIKPHLQLITCSLLMRTSTIICHSYKHKHLHDVYSLCINQQTRGVCALQSSSLSCDSYACTGSWYCSLGVLRKKKNSWMCCNLVVVSSRLWNVLDCKPSPKPVKGFSRYFAVARHVWLIGA